MTSLLLRTKQLRQDFSGRRRLYTVGAKINRLVPSERRWGKASYRSITDERLIIMTAKSTRRRIALKLGMKKLCLAASCMLCLIVGWRYHLEFDPTEFSGGWLT